jgi:hypothetical protein
MTTILREFLDSRRVTHANWNLTGLCSHIGKYAVADEEYGDFLKIYHDHVFVDKHQAFLLERHSPTAAPILIDLDLRYPLTSPIQRGYDRDNITQFITQYTEALHHFIVVDSPLRFYVHEIPSPLEAKGQCKDGIHIVCPDIALKYDDLFVLRKFTLDNNIIQSAFPGLSCSAEDCFDESVIKRNNWFLYGSSKSSDRIPYTVTTCFVLDPDGTLTEESVRGSPMEYVSSFSIRAAAPSSYTIRPDIVEEWATWTSICDSKPVTKKKAKKATQPITEIVTMEEDLESIASHRSDHISKIMKQPGLLWEVTEVDDGFKLTHNSKRCLVAADTEHSTLGHSCVFVTDTAANMVCFSHKSKRIAKPIATALWNMLSNKVVSEDELTARYTVMKEAFEKKTFRILDPPGYRALVNNKWVPYNRALLMDMNSGLFIDDEKKCKFTEWWLRDESIRTYSKMDYFVDPHDCPTDVFNTFDGFAASRLPHTDADITPILEHFSVLCNYETAATEFLLDWFAAITQAPWKLNGIAIVFMGSHGCGKDILMTWFGSVIVGMENYHKTGRPHIDLFSSFNSSRKNAIFYHIEEGNSDAIQPAMVEQFKNYITDPYASIQMKNENTMSLSKNYNHFVLTTNKKIPFHIEKTERRMFAVRASADKARNHEYFHRLGSAIADTGVSRAFYDFLMARDISDRDWLNPPPTAALAAWKTECMPTLEPFIEYFKANNETPCDILSSQLYKFYSEWCEILNEESLTLTSFGTEMQQIDYVSKGRNSLGKFYRFV